MRLPVPFVAAAIVFALSAGGAFAASAVQKECSVKYQAAKAGNTLNGMNYKQFYSQCAAQARAAGTTPAAVAPTTTAAPAPATPAPATPAPTTASRAPAAPAPATTPAGPAVFPTAISPQYKSLTAGKARFKTCDDQYRANKTTNGNGGLKWIEKGGGYYSECNKKLKG